MSVRTFEETIWTIHAMIKQEQSAYRISDYLEGLPSSSEFGTPVDSKARLLIARWLLQVATTCDYSRESAAIAMSCLDRFMASDEGRDILLSRSQFQKAALVALYIAVKIHEEKALSPDVIATLSRGKHSADEIEEMELQMLKAIEWRVNPPTSMSFARTFLELVPEENLESSMRDVIMELTECQVEYAILNYNLCQESLCCISYASLMNSVVIVCGDSTLSSGLNAILSKITGVEGKSLRSLRGRLNDLIPIDKFSDLLSTPQIRRYSNVASTYSKGSDTQVYSTSPRGVNEELS